MLSTSLLPFRQQCSRFLSTWLINSSALSIAIADFLAIILNVQRKVFRCQQTVQEYWHDDSIFLTVLLSPCRVPSFEEARHFPSINLIVARPEYAEKDEME